MTVDLRFGTPDHGWLEVKLIAGERKSVIDASDVPGDSLRELATAMLHILGGRDAEVTWFLEPVERTWRFVVDIDAVRVSESDDGRQARTLLMAGVEEVALAVWRGLRRLEAEPVWSSQTDVRVWSHEFPHREVAALGAKLGR